MMIHAAADAPVVFEQDGVIGRCLAKVADLEYLELTLAPGTELARHALLFAIEFYVVAGEGEFLGSEGDTPVVRGQLVEVIGGSPRGWRNTGEGELVLLGVKHAIGD